MARKAQQRSSDPKTGSVKQPQARSVGESTNGTLQVKMTIEMPENLRDELRLRAVQQRTTIRGVILQALKASGYSVDESEIGDGRTTRR